MQLDTIAARRSCVACAGALEATEYKGHDAVRCVECGTPLVVLWGDASAIRSRTGERDADSRSILPP